MNRVTTFESFDEMKKNGWIPARNILSWINVQVGFRVHKSEDFPDYPNLPFAVVKDGSTTSIKLSLIDEFILNKEENSWGFFFTGETKVEIRKTAIRLNQELNLLKKPGCYISAYHIDELNKILLHPLVISEKEKREKERILKEDKIKADNIEKYKAVKGTEFYTWIIETCGDIHDCPNEIYNQKKASGLSWKNFKSQFEEKIV